MSGRKKFEKAIAEAATYDDYSIADPSAEWSPEDDGSAPKPKGKSPQNASEAQAEANAAFAAIAASIGDKHGVAVIWQKPRVGRKRTSAEYKFWKIPVMGFIEFPETLDLGPTALVRKYGPAEPNFKVTQDTIRAPLSGPARKELGTLLKSRGYSLKLPPDFSVRDVQKAMKDQRDRAAGVRRFKADIEIVGDTVCCNGKSFKMQPTGSDKMRIKVADGWLPVDRLTAFLSTKA